LHLKRLLAKKMERCIPDDSQEKLIAYCHAKSFEKCGKKSDERNALTIQYMLRILFCTGDEFPTVTDLDYWIEKFDNEEAHVVTGAIKSGFISYPSEWCLYINCATCV